MQKELFIAAVKTDRIEWQGVFTRLVRVWGAFLKLKERTKPEPLTIGKEWPPLGQERARERRLD